MNGFVAKPIDVELLFRELDRVLNDMNSGPVPL